MTKISRREFISSGSKAALGVGLGMLVADGLATPVRAQEKKTSPNDKLIVGVIGIGGMGVNNMKEFMNHPDVEVAAVCDVDERALNRAAAIVEKKYGKSPQKFKDFRNIIDLKDVDVVVVNTPDHWHALPMIYACEAGKDVFVEKPISHDIFEGQVMVAAAKKNGTVVQVNTWQRSVPHFMDAMDFVQSGKMGKINVCRAWKTGNAGVGHAKPEAPPKELDWDFWLGPAPYTPYRSNIHPFNFRWYFDYAGGMAGDWGVHMIDTVLLGMNQWHPQEIASFGRLDGCAADDDRTTPTTQMTIYKFPDFVMNWEIHVGGVGLDGGSDHGAEFIGEKGVLIIDRYGTNWKPVEKGMPGPVAVPREKNHCRDFLDCVKARTKPRSDIETMHYTTTACHLSNLAYLTGRTIKWDGEKGVVVGDKKAMNCHSYRREYRKPWSLPKIG